MRITDEHRARAKVAYASWRDAGRVEATLTDVIALAMAESEQKAARRCAEIADRAILMPSVAKSIRAEFNIND